MAYSGGRRRYTTSHQDFQGDEISSRCPEHTEEEGHNTSNTNTDPRHTSCSYWERHDWNSIHWFWENFGVHTSHYHV